MPWQVKIYMVGFWPLILLVSYKFSTVRKVNKIDNTIQLDILV